MEHLKITVDEKLAELRLDQAIAAQSSLSRSFTRKIIKVGGCYLNRKRIRKNSAALKSKDRVELYWWPPELDYLEKPPTLVNADDILYQDSDLVAINKPAGLPSQGTKSQNCFHVIQQVEQLYQRVFNSAQPLFLVHRLDRGTSGVMILAKNKKSLKKLSSLFAERQVDKVYHALCSGQSKADQWHNNLALSKISPTEGRVFLDPKGQSASTEFQVLAQNPTKDINLIEARPITGRTHQIRAHLESDGLSIIGDKNYCADSNQKTHRLAEGGQLLHAREISFHHSKIKQTLKIEAPYSEQFAESMGRFDLNLTNFDS